MKACTWFCLPTWFNENLPAFFTQLLYQKNLQFTFCLLLKSFKSGWKSEIKKTKIKSKVEPEFDYYAIMSKEEKKIIKKQDTIVYETQSDSKIAAELQKENSRVSNKYYGRDNKVMVLIESQDFIMGSDTGSELESPAHTVMVNSFYMDIYEVTNAEFIHFLEDSGYKEKEQYQHFNDQRFNDPRQPMVDVSYDDALAYTKWAGKRLPSEEEWECAARSGDNRLFPTGTAINTSMAHIKGNTRIKGTKEVGSFKSNKYGVFDLAGNVEEWVAGVLSRYPGNKGTNSSYGKIRVTRGGNWKTAQDDLSSYRRSTLRISSATGLVGFRCVISASEVARRQQ